MSVITNQTLRSFLNTLQLEQYHEAFIKAGATDQDLGQIIQFTEQELSEFLAALNMLPFHSIKFKKAVRQFNSSQQPQEQPTIVAITTTNDTVIFIFILSTYLFILICFHRLQFHLLENLLRLMLLFMEKRQADH